MNRVEFIGQTHQGTLISIEDIIQFFDHTMAAYEIVGEIEDAHICGSTDSLRSLLKIKVESPDLAKLQEAIAYINDTIHNHKDVYGRSFKIDAVNNGASIDLFVREEYK